MNSLPGFDEKYNNEFVSGASSNGPRRYRGRYESLRRPAAAAGTAGQDRLQAPEPHGGLVANVPYLGRLCTRHAMVRTNAALVITKNIMLLRRQLKDRTVCVISII